MARWLVVAAAGVAVLVVLTFGGYGASYAVARVARCDPGCAEDDPSTSQVVHDVAGSLGSSGARGTDQRIVEVLTFVWMIGVAA